MHDCEIEDDELHPQRANVPAGAPPRAEWPKMDDPDENTFRILVATDIHLGFLEKDPIRGNDSFRTFEEVLQAAVEYKADFILLGGDLFHENKPSRATVYKAMELIRKYCFGDKPVEVQVVSDQTLNFPNKFGQVNYEDPNFNIAIPVFSIHGNHDDPAGEGGLAALDLLSVCNLVNYFGKSDNIDEISIFPILLTKGTSKLALYGLGAIRDERLHRTFAQKKVKFMQPAETPDDWFNLFVLHQNRLAHTPKNFIHEEMIDDRMNLVVWAHEHECLIQPHQSLHGFHITQPGSTIATSMGESEAAQKHVGLLEVREGAFKMTPIPLKTVRPFLSHDIQLSPEEVDPNDQDAVMNFLAEKVTAMIDEVNCTWPKYENEDATSTSRLPLIRLRIDHHLGGFQTVSPARFGQRFVGKVANPNDLLLYLKKKRETKADRTRIGNVTEEAQISASRRKQIDRTDVNALIKSYLTSSTAGADSLDILGEYEFNRALHNFVEKDERTALNDFVESTLERVQKLLLREDPQKTSNPDEIAAIVIQRTAAQRKKEQEEHGKKEGEHNSEEEEESEGRGKDQNQKNKKKGNGVSDDVFNDETFITPAKRKPLAMTSSSSSKKKNDGESVTKAKKSKKPNGDDDEDEASRRDAAEDAEDEPKKTAKKPKNGNGTSVEKKNTSHPSAAKAPTSSSSTTPTSSRQAALDIMFSGNNNKAGLFKNAKPSAASTSAPPSTAKTTPTAPIVIPSTSSASAATTPTQPKPPAKRAELNFLFATSASASSTPSSASSSATSSQQQQQKKAKTVATEPPTLTPPVQTSTIRTNVNTFASNGLGGSGSQQKKGVGSGPSPASQPKKITVPMISTLDLLGGDDYDNTIPPLLPPLATSQSQSKPLAKNWGGKKI